MISLFKCCGYGWDKKEYLDAQRAIDAYGDEGVDNGVTIAQGETTDNAPAETVVVGTTKTNYDAKTNPNGQNIWVIFNKKANVLGKDTVALASLAAHEGVHVADGSDWVSSGFSHNALPSSFQTEWDAYQVQARILEGLGVANMTMPWPDRNYSFFLPLSPASSTLTNMIRHEYPLYNLDAFSRNTKTPRP